jgi:hypothetical protein
MRSTGAVNRSIVPTVQYPKGQGSENASVNQVTTCDRNSRFVEELESALKQGALEFFLYQYWAAGLLTGSCIHVHRRLLIESFTHVHEQPKTRATGA